MSAPRPEAPGLSVIIPANDEADYIGACLDALLAQTGAAEAAGPVQIVVAANACRDDTVARARAREGAAAARGWRLEVLDLPEGGKPGALNAADRVASGGIRAYLDADVICAPELLGQLVAALDRPEPRYASGRLTFAPMKSWATRRYAAGWARVPYLRMDVPGAGLFAVNAAGRARWGAFPAIISDDGFVRLQFSPEERIGVPAPYVWPLVEGWRRLVRVRRRQDAGMREIAEKYPEILANDGVPPPGPGGHLRMFLAGPADYLVYSGICAAVRLGDRGRKAGAKREWTRGR